MKTFITILLYGFAITIPIKPQPPKQVQKNNMSVMWKYVGNNITFKLEAPTKGWIAIGINETDNISGSYLIMSRIQNGESEVQEFKTLAAGNYKPIADLGGTSLILSSEGAEIDGSTSITFSVRITNDNGLQKDLSEGNDYCLHMAYSSEKDFQHHSIMRTSVQVKL